MKRNTSNLIKALAEREPKTSLQRRVAAMALGVVAALRTGQLSIQNAWDELFNIDNYAELRRRRVIQPLLELFEYGMELENVADISPTALDESFDQIERLARRALTASVGRRIKRRAG